MRVPRPPSAVVVLVDLVEEGVAVDSGAEPGGEEEGASELAMQRVAVLGGRGQPVLQQRGNETVDVLGRVLVCKVKRLVPGKGLPESGGGIDVGVHAELRGEGWREGREGGQTWRSCWC